MDSTSLVELRLGTFTHRTTTQHERFTMSLFDDVTLIDLDDDELQSKLDENAKGKPAIYKAPVRELVKMADALPKAGRSFEMPWIQLNGDATKRQTVVMGMTAAVKRNDNAIGRVTVRANNDPAMVTVVLRKVAATVDTVATVAAPGTAEASENASK